MVTIRAILWPHRWRRAPLVVAMIGALIAAPVTVWASHQFVDVPDSNQFHNDIGAIADAGITGGFAGAQFKPADPIQRQTMAAFLHRGLGRMAIMSGLGNLSASTTATLLGSATFQIDGVPNKRQAVVVDVFMQLDHDSAIGPTPCGASFTLRRSGSATVLDTWSQDEDPNSVPQEDNVAFRWVTLQASASSATYEIYGANSCTVDLFTDRDMVTIQNVPFAGDGDAFLPAAVPDSHDEPDRGEH